MKKTFSIVIIFLAAQIAIPVVTTYLLGIAQLQHLFGVSSASAVMTSPAGLSVMMLVIYAVIMLALYGFRLLSPAAGLIKRAPYIPLALLILIFAELPLSYLQEILTLPDFVMGQGMRHLMHNFIGILTIAVIGPVVEEFTFRRAMLGALMEGGSSPLKAAIISGIIFGLIHINPAQIPTAIILGILLGWIYARTGSLLTTCSLHIFNNSLCVIIANSPLADTPMTRVFGSGSIAAVAAILCLGIAILLLRIYDRKTKKEGILFATETIKNENEGTSEN